MAAIVERSTIEDIADAIAALDDVRRYTEDARAHLLAAVGQDPIEPGTLTSARHVAGIVASSASDAVHAVRMAVARQLADATD